MYRIEWQPPGGGRLAREVQGKDQANEVYQGLLFDWAESVVVWESKTTRAKFENDWIEVVRWELRTWVSSL